MRSDPSAPAPPPSSQPFVVLSPLPSPGGGTDRVVFVTNALPRRGSPAARARRPVLAVVVR